MKTSINLRLAFAFVIAGLALLIAGSSSFAQNRATQSADAGAKIVAGISLEKTRD
ncbi:MAG: hypothetical protein JST22_07935, partial [Bacteroidetes bacterium]|nr:hypothetical protein [Bacteroidota bacterium]